MSDIHIGSRCVQVLKCSYKHHQKQGKYNKCSHYIPHVLYKSTEKVSKPPFQRETNIGQIVTFNAVFGRCRRKEIPNITGLQSLRAGIIRALNECTGRFCLNCVASFKSCIKYCGRSCRDKNTTTKCDVRTEVYTNKGKIIYPSPLRGGGIKHFRNDTPCG